MRSCLLGHAGERSAPIVNLLNNPEKAAGPAGEIARYKRVFGVGEQQAIPVEV